MMKIPIAGKINVTGLDMTVPNVSESGVLSKPRVDGAFSMFLVANHGRTYRQKPTLSFTS
jgi:hypothetical protein